MKRVMLMMVLAALLLTQCRRPSIEFPSAEVRMTVTAGPSSKTDIYTTGGITWSAGDKIYVGCNGRYVGCLNIVNGVGSPTGTFTGTVTGVSEGDQEFHFFYLGNAKDYSLELTTSSTSVPVDFSSQDIYAEGGKLKNANNQHVGYGTASGEVDGDAVVGLNVEMKSKVAIAYFHFESGEIPTPYTGALTLSGDHIYSSMTVGFGGTFSPGTNGDISLAGGHAQRYVMLVPPANVASETLNFSGGATGVTALENGIEANKFYRVDGSMPIVVEVEAPAGPQAVGWKNATSPKAFSVSSTKKVYFSQGNLQWSRTNGTGTNTTHTTAGNNSSSPLGNEGTWRFAEHQFDYIGSGNKNISSTYNGWIDLFGWATSGWNARTSETCYYMPYETNTSGSYYGPTTSGNPSLTGTYAKSDWGVYNDISNDGTLGVGAWRTLTTGYIGEWRYLVGERTNASTLCGKGMVEDVCGLIILPDDFNWTSTGLSQWTSSGHDSNYNDNVYTYSEWHTMETEGAVFLPAAGYRHISTISDVGTRGYYWSVSGSGEPVKLPRTSAFSMEIDNSWIYSNMQTEENKGLSVRLVRDAN